MIHHAQCRHRIAQECPAGFPCECAEPSEVCLKCDPCTCHEQSFEDVRYKIAIEKFLPFVYPAPRRQIFKLPEAAKFVPLAGHRYDFSNVAIRGNRVSIGIGDMDQIAIQFDTDATPIPEPKIPDPHADPRARALYYGVIPTEIDKDRPPSRFLCLACVGTGGSEAGLCGPCHGSGSVGPALRREQEQSYQENR